MRNFWHPFMSLQRLLELPSSVFSLFHSLSPFGLSPVTALRQVSTYLLNFQYNWFQTNYLYLVPIQTISTSHMMLYVRPWLWYTLNDSKTIIVSTIGCVVFFNVCKFRKFKRERDEKSLGDVNWSKIHVLRACIVLQFTFHKLRFQFYSLRLVSYYVLYGTIFDCCWR